MRLGISRNQSSLKNKSFKRFREDWRGGPQVRKSILLLPIVPVLMAGLMPVAYPQSLADLANKERERREAITDVRVITAEEAEKFITEPAVAASADDGPGSPGNSEEAAGEAKSGGQREKTAPDEPLDFFGRPESYWRKAMSDARQRIKDLENERNVLALKQNRLQNEFYREDDGFQREKIQREMQKTFYEQDLNKENLKEAGDALDDLKKEARKSGALPGWISGK